VVLTVPVKAQHSFDQTRLRAFLTANIEGFDGDFEVSQFEGGQSNPTFMLESASGQYVLRRKPPGKLARSAHAVDREFRVMRALAGSEVPVPETLVLCEDDAVIGTAFFVMRYVPGRIFTDPTLPDLAKDERAQLIFDYVDTLAKLHAVDYVSVGLAEFGRPGNYFERQISRWGRQYQENETEIIAEMHTLLTALQGSVPEQPATTIVHGDFQLGNSLIDPELPRIAAVLDWELSTIGDPLADFTYFTGPWHAAPGERSYAGLDLDELGIPQYEALVARYCARVGISEIEHENFYRAFHAFRSAAILQGIMRRAMQGNNAGDLALTFTPDHVRTLAQRGMQYVEGAT